MTKAATATIRVPFHNVHATEEDVVVTLPSTATELTFTITARRTRGLRWVRPYSTASGRMSRVCRTGSQTVACTFELHTKAVLEPGSYTFAVQLGSSGIAHDMRMDTFDLTYTSGGLLYEQTGSF